MTPRFTMGWAVFSSPVVLSLAVFFKFASGEELDYGNMDYGERFDDYMTDVPPDRNETLTIDQVQHMIEEAAKDQRYQILTDPELPSLIQQEQKRFFEARAKCMADESMYYDYVIGDCRSCLRGNCDKDEVCKTECHLYSELEKLRNDIKNQAKEHQSTKSEVKDLQKNQNTPNYQLWLIILTILQAFTCLALIVSFCWIARGKKGLSTVCKPSEDAKAEMQTLCGARTPNAAENGNGNGRCRSFCL